MYRSLWSWLCTHPPRRTRPPTRLATCSAHTGGQNSRRHAAPPLLRGVSGTMSSSCPATASSCCAAGCHALYASHAASSWRVASHTSAPSQPSCTRRAADGAADTGEAHAADRLSWRPRILKRCCSHHPPHVPATRGTQTAAQSLSRGGRQPRTPPRQAATCWHRAAAQTCGAAGQARGRHGWCLNCHARHAAAAARGAPLLKLQGFIRQVQPERGVCGSHELQAGQAGTGQSVSCPIRSSSSRTACQAAHQASRRLPVAAGGWPRAR